MKNIDELDQEPLSEAQKPHPLWFAVLFLLLVVIFFPWSLLIFLLIFGWEGSVELFRAVVLGTLGLAVTLTLVVITGLFFLVPIALLVLVAISGG